MSKRTTVLGFAVTVIAGTVLVACSPNGPLVASKSPTPAPTASASPSSTPVPSSPAVKGPGSWQRGQPMSIARADFTSTLLPDGRVLLAGGQTASGATATAELFDPATNAFTSANSMSAPRAGQTATLLANGKVLIAGGSPGKDLVPVATAELYDPATNSWSPAPSMSEPRVHHSALLLADGRVLVVGGDQPAARAATWEVYDPLTNVWTSVPGFLQRTSGVTLTQLADGRVLVYGGWAVLGPYTADFFDPSTGKYAWATHAIPTPRGWATAARLPNGNVIVVGGQITGDQSGALNSTDVYVPGGDSWIDGPTMRVGHCHHTMTTLAGGALLVAGGRCGTGDSIAVAELFDPATQKWTLAAPLDDAVGYATAVRLNDGRVLVAGGLGAGGGVLSETQLYTAA